MVVTTRNSSKKEGKEPQNEEDVSPRERRRCQRQDLRSKSTGVGISISHADGPNKKIVFDDNNESELQDSVESEQPEPESSKTMETSQNIPDSDSDDDAVEEVKGQEAKLMVQQQRDLERTTARDALKKSRKRKRKNRLDKKKPPVDEEDFDDSFFEQLDAEIKAEKSSLKREPVKGRHTTFVAKDEAFQATAPRQVDDNLQVVVLKDAGGTTLDASNTFKTSSAALFFSRGQIKDGSDVVSARQLQKAKKAGKKAVDNTTWKRSRKMNRLLLPGAQNKRRRGQGVAAPHFVVET